MTLTNLRDFVMTLEMRILRVTNPGELMLIEFDDKMEILISPINLCLPILFYVANVYLFSNNIDKLYSLCGYH